MRGSQYGEEGGGLVTLGVVTGWPLSRRQAPVEGTIRDWAGTRDVMDHIGPDSAQVALMSREEA